MLKLCEMEFFRPPVYRLQSIVNWKRSNCRLRPLLANRFTEIPILAHLKCFHNQKVGNFLRFDSKRQLFRKSWMIVPTDWNVTIYKIIDEHISNKQYIRLSQMNHQHCLKVNIDESRYYRGNLIFFLDFGVKFSLMHQNI